MAQFIHSTHSVTFEVPYEKAFAYLSDWRKQPEWATQFVLAIRQEGEQIILTSPQGEMPIEWRTNRDLGTIDMIFPGGSVLPTRLTAIGDSLIYNFTISLPANTPSVVLEQAKQNMDEELHNLKRILEG